MLFALFMIRAVIWRPWKSAVQLAFTRTDGRTSTIVYDHRGGAPNAALLSLPRRTARGLASGEEAKPLAYSRAAVAARREPGTAVEGQEAPAGSDSANVDTGSTTTVVDNSPAGKTGDSEGSAAPDGISALHYGVSLSGEGRKKMPWANREQCLLTKRLSFSTVTHATIQTVGRTIINQGTSRSYSCAVFRCASHFRRATLWPRACALGLIGSWTLVDALG